MPCRPPLPHFWVASRIIILVITQNQSRLNFNLSATPNRKGRTTVQERPPPGSWVPLQLYGLAFTSRARPEMRR
eukprot:645634-Prymnesium_polylepis.1